MMRRVIWLGVIALCPLMAQHGLKNGDPVSSQNHGPLAPIRNANRPARILWDTSHGVYPNIDPADEFSELTALLAAKGQEVEFIDAGVLSLDLRLYTTLVINLITNWDRPYSDAEADRIFEWVQNGGNLLIMSDNDLTPNENLANVAERFGVAFSDLPLLPTVLFLEHFSSHPVVAGLTQVFIPAGGDLLIHSPMEAAAWDDTGRILVSVGKFGGGHVVVIGDASLWSNEVLDVADNQLFAENVFDALSVATVPTLSTLYLVFYAMGLLGLALRVEGQRRGRA